MARCKTYQDYQDDAYYERNGLSTDKPIQGELTPPSPRRLLSRSIASGFSSYIVPDTSPATITIYYCTHRGRDVRIRETDYNGKRDYSVAIDGEKVLWATEATIKKELETLLR